jgi:hypothetical protein
MMDSSPASNLLQALPGAFVSPMNFVHDSDTQALAPSAANMDRLKLPTLYTLQNGLP